MKQDILNAVCGDKKKYNSIMERTQQPDTARLRWEVYVILKSKGYSVGQIKNAFGVTRNSVNYGISKVLPKNKEYKKIIDITPDMIKSIKSENIDIIYHELYKLGFSSHKIAVYFNTKYSRVAYRIRKARAIEEMKEFEDRRSKFVKL